MKKKNNLPKILLIDDDKDMCESLADVLSIDSAYDINYSTNPVKAFDMIKDDDYDLIIVDYKMPEMNGIDLIKKVRSIKADITIFMLTAFISTELITQAKQEGANKVLSKFIWPDEIIKHINDAVK